MQYVLLTSCSTNDKPRIKEENNNTVSEVNTVDSVDIVGAWDKGLATKIILGLLNRNIDSVQNNYLHSIIDFYNIDYEGKEAIIGVCYSREKNANCHGCSVEMSFIEFFKYENGWKIQNKFIRQFEIGSWGNPPTDWKLLNIGHNKYAFVVEEGFGNQGFFDSNYYIYAVLGGEFKKIGEIPSSTDDKGALEISQNSFESNIEIVKEGTGFYDLIVNMKGIEKGKQFERKDYYKFDGIKYSLSNNIK